jgi:arsenate reductase (thioredoxin)
MTMGKIRVLFVCVHNAARSQIAEAFLNHLAGDRFEAESAGLEPAALNPLAVAVMAEIGIDISGNRADSVFEFYKQNRPYKYVIAVCDEAAERCPLFPTFGHTMHWSFPDPASFSGSHEERLERTRQLRDEVRKRIEQLIKEEQDRDIQ